MPKNSDLYVLDRSDPYEKGVRNGSSILALEARNGGTGIMYSTVKQQSIIKADTAVLRNDNRPQC